MNGRRSHDLDLRARAPIRESAQAPSRGGDRRLDAEVVEDPHEAPDARIAAVVRPGNALQVERALGARRSPWGRRAGPLPSGQLSYMTVSITAMRASSGHSIFRSIVAPPGLRPTVHISSTFCLGRAPLISPDAITAQFPSVGGRISNRPWRLRPSPLFPI